MERVLVAVLLREVVCVIFGMDRKSLGIVVLEVSICRWGDKTGFK